MKVSLVSATQVDPSYAATLMEAHPEAVHVTEPEGLMAYVARVSSPTQTNPSYAGLLKYCADHGHWSIFEMIDVTFEIVTSRAIAAQILRHRSFSFQEFSQRYAPVTSFEIYQPRRQDSKNRQNSIDDLHPKVKEWYTYAMKRVHERADAEYKQALSMGIAKESARFLLPLSTTTKLYMKGSLRSWIHYCQVRNADGVQLEHREIAAAIQQILSEKFPYTFAKVNI